MFYNYRSLSGKVNPYVQLNSDYFADFNWHNFQVGDLVWIEDVDDADAPAALFLGITTSNQTVHLLGVPASEAHKIGYAQSQRDRLAQLKNQRQYDQPFTHEDFMPSNYGQW